MPLKLDGKGTSCCYAMCTNNGHSSCDVVVTHYDRLCAAVRAVLADPGIGALDPDTMAQLQAVHDEAAGLEGA